MSRLIFSILLLSAAIPAKAQEANFNYLGNQTNATVATANSFTNPSVLPQQTGRQSCIIQYRPNTNVLTDTKLGFVFFGAAAPTGTLTSFVLTSFGIFDCESAGEVDGNAVWLSSTNTGDTFTIKVK